MVIAVDFDGTLVEHAYPKIGKPVPFAIETLKYLQQDGHTLLMWTVRTGRLLDEAIEYVEKNGVKFYAYNKNHPDEDPQNAPRKLDADIFIDDRNVGGLPDWGLIYKSVKAAERGEMTFDVRLNSEQYDNKYDRRSGKKKNFFIRLGEMFEKDY